MEAARPYASDKVHIKDSVRVELGVEFTASLPTQVIVLDGR